MKKKPSKTWDKLLVQFEGEDEKEDDGYIFRQAFDNATSRNELDEFVKAFSDGWSDIELIDFQIGLLESLKRNKTNGS